MYWLVTPFHDKWTMQRKLTVTVMCHLQQPRSSNLLWLFQLELIPRIQPLMRTFWSPLLLPAEDLNVTHQFVKIWTCPYVHPCLVAPQTLHLSNFHYTYGSTQYFTCHHDFMLLYKSVFPPNLILLVYTEGELTAPTPPGMVSQVDMNPTIWNFLTHNYIRKERESLGMRIFLCGLSFVMPWCKAVFQLFQFVCNLMLSHSLSNFFNVFSSLLSKNHHLVFPELSCFLV